ncbi:hypothetical protein ARMGADRAFT_1089348 [Armillaria gallica]|uniref:Uncharacterized protein n=1 Tax=Armillaria gallica TaxID=47427 RepID=A0A2H3D5A0_ARMGA|nr:hypothetical protein ARMGADRAFT_1089348 [Armillaria gallica]
MPNADIRGEILGMEEQLTALFLQYILVNRDTLFNTLGGTGISSSRAPWWIVFFAPPAAEFLCDIAAGAVGNAEPSCKTMKVIATSCIQVLSFVLVSFFGHKVCTTNFISSPRATRLLTEVLVRRETGGIEMMDNFIVEVPDMEERDSIDGVEDDEKPQLSALADSAGSQKKRMFFRRIVQKLVSPGNRSSTFLSFV